MEYRQRGYPRFSACGLNCGLCPRHHTGGTSRCPGCAGAGFSQKHPACGVLSCCQRRGLDYCFECDLFPCKRFDGADRYDSFISHQNQLADLERARAMGMEACAAELDEKVALLEALLAGYDSGRQKSLFCTAANLLPLADLARALGRIEAEVLPGAPPRERSAAAVGVLEGIAGERGLSLRLRKKPKP